MIGKEILNYVIIAKIGSGGMGCVFLAEHKFIKQQKVAIKMIKSEVFNDFAKSKLKEEAERLASLDHPNIVKFLNYDIDAQGNVYLIMEYAEGATLDQYINSKTGLIVEERILPLFEPILDAFEYAHKKKVVHRDIKPANIIITTEGIPKILDFGISTIVDEANPAEETFIMGTPSYMSPEQVKGKGIDTRSDIYSLGVLLHQMLTGNAPYDTTTLSEQDINEKVVTEPLPRMKSYYHYISDKLQTIVDKATAKGPKERYQTCAEFKRAMRKALIKEPVSKSVIAIAVVVVILIVGGCGYWWDYNRIKVRYYKDYVEQWGVPQGIGKLSGSDQKHMHRMYRFEYQKHKLQRISHVNNHGNIIDDGESERYERPLNMRLYYSDNGKVNSAKVYDRSGKVLYVKSYNDKLNTVVFQFDDEHGTEKSLGAQTIGYVNSLGEQGEKGKITRWLIEYDEHGYPSSIQYAGFQNVRVADAHNIYGRRYVRDSKGRVVEEHYLGYDGSPKATKWGLGIKKFYFDENDNWIKAEYLTVDGEPALDDADGVCVYTLDYDKYGNVTQAYHRNSDGLLMAPKKHGIASIKNTYDSHGMLIETVYLDVEEQPCYEQNKVSKVIYSYDDNGYQNRLDCYDTEGKLCLMNQGFASMVNVNDEHGNAVETWYYDLQGELIANSAGVAGYKTKYDSVGNVIEQVSYGIDGNPCLQADGTVGYRTEYDDRNLLTKITYLSVDLTPSAGYDHVGIAKLEYDKRGNLTKRSFYDATDSHLVLSDENIAGCISVYDDNGNEIERMFFDDKNQPCVCSNGYAKCTYVYDKMGNQISYRYYNLNGSLVLIDGIAGCNYKYDERGNILEDMSIGLDEKLANGKLIVRYKYDNFDNQTETAFFDKNNKPKTNYAYYHKETYKYNNRNQCVETRYYGTDGKLTRYNNDKYAVSKEEYDNRGNRIKTWYFGIDEKPVCCNEGWAFSTREFNAMGNVVKQSFFSIDGKPTDPNVMVPEGFVKYDKWGNMAYVAAGDGNGNLIYNPQTGCCITRYEYDSRGNVLITAFFDEKDKPMTNRQYGYHKAENDYTASGKEQSACYFGTDGNPVSCKDGYHKEVYDYNGQEQVIRISYWNTKGKAVDCSVGFHKIEQDYNDSGIAISRKYYSASNQLLLTQAWNGRDWVNEIDWGPSIRALDKKCPNSFGEDFGNIVLVSAKVTGNYSCSFTFKVPYSKYELSIENIESYKTTMNQVVAYYKQEELPSNVSVKGILYDSKGRELCKITK